MAIRITNLTAASAIEQDDFIVIDGETSGTRKALVSALGGESLIDFTSSITPSIDNRGVYSVSLTITPTDPANCNISDALKMTLYLQSGTQAYKLIIASVTTTSSVINAIVKSIYGNVQNTSSTSISGTLHVLAPFEISSVAQGM